MRKQDKTKRIAMGGILCALALVVLLLSTIFPMAEYSCPAIAGVILIISVIEYGKRFALLQYIVIAILALLIVPNKEAAMLFVAFLGFYPILKSVFEQIRSRIAEWALKLLVFNAGVIAAYFVLTKLFGMSELIEQLSFGVLGVLPILLIGNIVFVVYDFALTKLIALYLNRIHQRLKRFF